MTWCLSSDQRFVSAWQQDCRLHKPLTYPPGDSIFVIMRFEWDPSKDMANQARHGVSFAEASVLLESDADYLELFDEAHS